MNSQWKFLHIVIVAVWRLKKVIQKNEKKYEHAVNTGRPAVYSCSFLEGRYCILGLLLQNSRYNDHSWAQWSFLSGKDVLNTPSLQIVLNFYKQKIYIDTLSSTIYLIQVYHVLHLIWCIQNSLKLNRMIINSSAGSRNFEIKDIIRRVCNKTHIKLPIKANSLLCRLQ